MNDINYYGKSIYYIITYIILVVAIILIVDEIVRMTIFCYNYTYNYNYGKINEDLCKNDEKTSIIEFEKARFRVLNSINKYKFHKDLFNKNWLNYINYLIVIIFTLLIIISFGILFYYYFIHNILSCSIEPTDENDMSTLKLFIKCMFGDLHKLIPNCTINYFILIIIIIIYPLIILFKSFLNLDYTWYGGFWSKAFHISVCITILLFIPYILKEKIIDIKKDNTINPTSIPISIKDKYLKILIYISFIAIFYYSQYVFNYSFNEYNSQLKTYDLYNNENDNNDTMFFDIYKQQEPIKPSEPDILKTLPKDITNSKDLLTTFKYCSESDFSASPPPEHCKNKENYKINLNSITDYYNTKKEYEENLKKYNNKYNIYKNNKINFPEILTVIQGLLPKFLGFDNFIFISLYITISIFILIFAILKFFNYETYTDFYYNTAIIYLIAIITIYILINSILTYNTFFNKYHIYEPLSNYKYDICKINTLFDLAISNRKNNQNYIHKLKFYYEITDKNFVDDSSETSTTNMDNIDDIIKKIKNNKYSDRAALTKAISIPEIVQTTHSNKSKIINAINLGILSEFLYLTDIKSTDYINIYLDTNTTNYYWNNRLTINKFNYYYEISPIFKLINSEKLEDATTNILTTDFNNFIQIIKGTALNNTNTIDNKINKIRKNIEYLIYRDSIDNNRLLLNKSNETNLYSDYLIQPTENIVINDLLANTNTDDLINNYNYNLLIINDILYQYSDFLLKVRDLIINLFNSSSVYCDSQITDINIFDKLDEYLNTMTKDKKFKIPTEEPNIEIYKQILKTTIDSFNNYYNIYFNSIKVLIFKKIDLENANTENRQLFDEIKNNYNIHFNFFNKYNDNDFINNKPLKINPKQFISKFKNLTTKDREVISLNIDSVSWGFVLLNIIFAIILLEPTLI